MEPPQNDIYEFCRLIVNYLANGQRGGTEPQAGLRLPGDPMDLSDFEYQLSQAWDKGEDAARSRLLTWTVSGKRPSSSGVAGFVLFKILSEAQDVLGRITVKINQIPGGPPWPQEKAKEIVDNLFYTFGAQAYEKWIASEAKSQYESWLRGYREVRGPDA